jgi:hypothetical protein
MKKIAALLGMVFLMFVVINANYIFAQPPLQEIIQRLDVIQQSLDYIEGYCGVPKTGQSTSYTLGDDGDLEKGSVWPIPRFTDNGNGTVTDNLTRLVWMQNENCVGRKNWADAIDFCNNLASGSCGLTDGSIAGDWRLPNVLEQLGLIDWGETAPAFPVGHPFINVQLSHPWSSTTHGAQSLQAWHVHLSDGRVNISYKTNENDVWCVRDAN